VFCRDAVKQFSVGQNGTSGRAAFAEVFIVLFVQVIDDIPQPRVTSIVCFQCRQQELVPVAVVAHAIDEPAVEQERSLFRLTGLAMVAAGFAVLLRIRYAVMSGALDIGAICIAKNAALTVHSQQRRRRWGKLKVRLCVLHAVGDILGKAFHNAPDIVPVSRFNSSH